MPKRPNRPCPGKGKRYRNCPNLIRGSATCCIECRPFEKARIRKYDKKRDESPGRKFLHSPLWRRIRKKKLDQDTLCERCPKQSQPPADLVHHKNRDELDNKPDNLESLCITHHEAEHKSERWGR